MSVVSLPFLLIAVGATLLLRSRRLHGHRARILTIAGLAFAACATAAAGDALCLAAMTATGWLAIRALSVSKSGLLLAGAIFLVVGEFLVTRQVLPHAAPSPWPAVGPTIGLSYVMFRILHLVVDAHGGEMPDTLKPRDYVCYLFCHLTFLAGPIQRFPEFSAGLHRAPAASSAEVMRTWLPTIALGYVKFTVVAGLFLEVFAWGQSPPPSCPPAVGLAVSLLAFALCLYASFAGYTDIMRGFGGLAGLDLPDNFDRPFLASDFLDFWSRWHISLSEWFKIYVFNPLVKTMIAANGRPALVPYLGVVGFFVTFLLMGLWHGVSPRFAAYGLVLGVGVSANKLYQVLMTRRLGRRGYSALATRPAYAASARALAVTYFVLALGFLWVAAPPSTNTAPAWGAAAVILFVAILALCEIAARMPATFAATPRHALSAGGIAIVLAYLFAAHGVVPPLLYEFF